MNDKGEKEEAVASKNKLEEGAVGGKDPDDDDASTTSYVKVKH